MTDEMTYEMDSPSTPVAFNPDAVKDEREKTLAEIKVRRGQREFRRKLLLAYESKCAVTECDCVDALDAAHIYPYWGTKTEPDETGGLLMRGDIHTLFDRFLICSEFARQITGLYWRLSSEMGVTQVWTELACGCRNIRPTDRIGKPCSSDTKSSGGSGRRIGVNAFGSMSPSV